jgi:hypothetical protein
VGPLDFVETLESTDWRGRFAPFAEPQLRQLRRYHQLAYELRRSSFFSRPLASSMNVSAEQGYQRLDHAGYDALRSAAMTFRQLWDEKEPARFTAVRNLLRRHALPARGGVDTAALLDVLGSRFRAATRLEMMRVMWSRDPLFEPNEVIRARQFIDDWMYGGAFHANTERAARLDRWVPVTYELTLAKALHAIVGVIWELHIVVGGALRRKVSPASRPKSLSPSPQTGHSLRY